MPQKKVEIMVVEDDSVDVENIRRAFAKYNICSSVFYAANGLEALNMLRGDGGVKKIAPTPSIILLDINMPKMNGIEFLQEIRKDAHLKHLIVFIFTTSDDENDKLAAYNLNVAGYILKPVKSEDFAKAMTTLDLYWSLIELPRSK